MFKKVILFNKAASRTTSSQIDMAEILILFQWRNKYHFIYGNDKFVGIFIKNLSKFWINDSFSSPSIKTNIKVQYHGYFNGIPFISKIFFIFFS